MHIGRIPARDLDQLANAFDKISEYVRITDVPSWLQKVMLLSGNGQPGAAVDTISQTLNDQLRTTEFGARNAANLITFKSHDFPAPPAWPANATQNTRTALNTGYGFVNALGRTVGVDNLVNMAWFNNLSSIRWLRMA